jgi:hypothetical protein
MAAQPERTMRGRIIHYNGNDGRGLIAADNRQLPFEIAHWRSDTAPAVNLMVELSMAGEALESVTRVPDDVLLKEKAGQFASKLGTAGGAALQSIKDAAPPSTAATAAGAWQSLGKPLLIAHGAFVVTALFLPFIAIQSPFGIGGKSFSLTGLSEASEAMGASVGGAFWPWLGILSIALPVFWRNRFAWLALLLPLFAAVKPAIDLALAARKASEQMSDALGADVGRQIAKQIADMLHIGVGAWICVLAALLIAAIGIKRVLLPPGG